MGTCRFGGVIFQVWSNDHLPRHVHARLADVRVVLQLGEDGVTVSLRRRAIQPSNAKTSVVARILAIARQHEAELNRIWEETQGAE